MFFGHKVKTLLNQIYCHLAVSSLDGSVQTASLSVTVKEPISIEDQMEVVCPDVVNPGQYFLCRMDIPKGNDLKVNFTLIDDVSGAQDPTGIMTVPGEIMHKLMRLCIIGNTSRTYV